MNIPALIAFSSLALRKLFKQAKSGTSDMFENLIETSIEFIQRKKDMAWSALSDLSFFFIYGLISSIILDRIRVHMLAAANIVQSNQDSLKNLNGGLNVDVFSTLVNIPGFNAAFNSMLFWLAILIISSYIIYVAFQIPSWKFISKKKIKDFAGSFLILTAGWISFFYIIDFLENARDFISVMQDLDRTKSFVFTIAFFILAYLAITSYSLIGVKNRNNKKFKTLRIAFRKRMVYSMIELAGLFLILNSLLAVLNLINYYAFLIVGIPSTMILLSFSKLHILRSVRQEKV